jgi:hypothetical protein
LEFYLPHLVQQLNRSATVDLNNFHDLPTLISPKISVDFLRVKRHQFAPPSGAPEHASLAIAKKLSPFADLSLPAPQAF